MSCRIHLRDASDRPVHPPGLPFWRDHFVCPGEVELSLDTGTYRYEIERGPEYHQVTGSIAVSESKPAMASHTLRRIADLAREGWWSGETHVHRPLRDIELLMKAEDLHVAPVITWWNSRGPWTTNPVPSERVIHFDGNRYYAPLAGEDERGGGALLYFGLAEPLPLDARLGREWPASTKYLRQAKAQNGAWVDIEKPFWWDTPIWLATGLIDSMGIAHNHMHRGGVLGDEAWGRPRDVARYPAPQGNGRYTQKLYYHVLNAGLRIPPSAGSASGVLPNPVGYNRAYVHIEGALSWEKWWAGLKAGRVFVSNGPLLRARANGRLPGHVFRGRNAVKIEVKAQLDSRDPIEAIELVQDGRIQSVTLPAQVEFRRSGWFLLRAIASPEHTFRFASTGPWYVEIENQAERINRESVQFFLKWTEERREAVIRAVTDSAQRAEAVTPIEEALQFWKERLHRSEDPE